MAPTDVVEEWNTKDQKCVKNIVQRYGTVPNDARDIVLLKESTAQTLAVEYSCGEGGDRKSCTIELGKLVGEQPSLANALEALSRMESASRIPPFTTPEPILVLTLVISLSTLGIVAMFPQDSYANWKYGAVLDSAAHAALLVFRSQTVAKRVFFGAVVAHIAEGLYVFYVLCKASPRGPLEWLSVVAWTLQTTICGFPSLTLLLGLVENGDGAKTSASERKED